VGASLKVPVTCSCGSSSVSREYGLFITYPLRPNETVEKVAAEMGFNSTTLLQSYNPGVDFSQGSGLVYIPGKGDKFRYALSSRNFYADMSVGVFLI
jgi:chitin elicitor receptor kinase 1